MASRKHRDHSSARGLALLTLDRVLSSGAYSNLQLKNTLQNSQLSEADTRLVTTLVYGTLQHLLTLKYWLKPFVKGKKVDHWVETLLLMTLYEYHYLTRVPNWAATDTSIQLAKTNGNPGIRRFVTGVLHAVLRRGLAPLDQIQDPHERLSVASSLPRWLVDALSDQYGWAGTQEIARAVDQPAHVSLRVNTTKTDLATVKDQLAAAGVETRESQVAENALVVTKGTVVNSELLKSGRVTIQDESAMLAVEALNVQAGDRVLDACAAPGGKTVQIAEHLSKEAGGHVTALDLHQNKVRLIQKNARRMGVSPVVAAEAMDARQVRSRFADQSFDRILVDAPCSGFGLLRRKPEIRYARDGQASRQLHQIQLEILDAVAPKLVKGGIMIYSTCTLLHAENDGTVAAFLSTHPNFSLEKVRTARAVKDDRDSATLTILPSDFGSDGFFISCLKRNY